MKTRGCSAVVVVWACLTAMASVALAADVEEALRNLERSLGAPVRSAVSPHTGAVTFLALPTTGRALRVPGGGGAGARARAFLSSHGRELKLPVAEETVVADASGPDEAGMEHVRLRQQAHGLPVRYGEITVHLRGNQVTAVHAKTVTDADSVDTHPTIASSMATASAATVIRDYYRRNDATMSEPTLELFNRGLLEGSHGATRLAWMVRAQGELLDALVWIDAHDGSVLLHFNQVPDALFRWVYDQGFVLGGPLTLVGSEGSPPLSPVDAVDVYNYSGDTYNYYVSEHGRDSFDGIGTSMTSIVRYCSDFCPCPCFNAYWFGDHARFGRSPFTMDDVVGHEWTHGVTQYSAGLIYYQASGALNESFSDIFGEIVDLTNGTGYDPPEARWLVAESSVLTTGIRNMTSPSTIWGDPPNMGSPLFYCGSGDSGGVHSNSAIGNHAFALMVDGGTFNGYTVSGIGLTKAGKIQYRSLTQYLTPTSGFSDNYDALLQACTDLIGVAGITAADCTEVQKALDAVEMYAPWPCDCGNGVIDAGEQCDDGNRLDGDCCSAICYSDTLGDACSDKDECTQGDSCQLDGATLTCVGSEEKRSDCRGSVGVETAKIAIKDTTPDTNDQLSFAYGKGVATSKADFGLPHGSTDYSLCLFRETGPKTLLHRAKVPGGSLCGSSPCWSNSRSGYKYKDRSGTNSGVTSISLAAGDAGRTKIKLKAKGLNLVPPAIALLGETITAQLINSEGICWDAEFPTPASSLTAEVYKDKGE